jgi:hypothetical protein
MTGTTYQRIFLHEQIFTLMLTDMMPLQKPEWLKLGGTSPMLTHFVIICVLRGCHGLRQTGSLLTFYSQLEVM